jgi:hypothetical protein
LLLVNDKSVLTPEKQKKMNSFPELIQYQEVFSIWAGSKVKINEDFETYCECDFDFIEILLLFESRFSLNLLDSSVMREDFKNVHSFYIWLIAQPKAAESYRPFEIYQPEIIPLCNWVE